MKKHLVLDLNQSGKGLNLRMLQNSDFLVFYYTKMQQYIIMMRKFYEQTWRLADYTSQLGDSDSTIIHKTSSVNTLVSLHTGR